MTLRIAVDATCWANARGYGRFARELMRELVVHAPEHEFVCIGDASAFAALPLEGPNVHRVVVPQDVPPTEAASADGYRSVRDMWRLSRAVGAVGADVFFSPSVYTYFPLPVGLRSVVTIHDAIAERFPRLTHPSRRARLFWRLKVAVAVRQARLILTVSEYAAAQVAAAHRLPRTRLRLAVEAPAPVFTPAGPTEVLAARGAIGLPDDIDYFTYVGGFAPHKRLDVVIRAHAALVGSDVTAPRLVLIGRLSGDAFLTSRDELLALIDHLGTAELVHWTDFLPDTTVRALHTGSLGSLLVSESEGFGLPAVEAAACGAPVIATRESPLPDLLRGAGIFVNPGDVEAVTDAMRQLDVDRAFGRVMGAAGIAAAGRLTWHRTAISTLAALEEAAT